MDAVYRKREVRLSQEVGDYGAVDWVNLIDELEYRSRWERQAWASNRVILLLHLLKWWCQPEVQSGS